MKQTLPWSVTGIPPDVREIARAAALKEGMSVGDWIARRIVAEREEAASTSGEEPAAAPARPAEAPRNPVAGHEGDATSAIRRIDEILRGMARRLEVGERLQHDGQRAMSSAASEMNAAVRNQAQAFQELTARIERVERSTNTSALKDAIRGLHQGLSRLAEQIAKTASESHSQIATLAGNVEALATKVAAAHDESERLQQLLDQRFSEFAERLAQNEAAIESAKQIDRRLRKIEERTASLSRAEDRLDEVEARFASLELDERVARLELRTNSNEERAQTALASQLAAIERNLDQLGARLERAELAGQSDATIKDALSRLSERIDASDRSNREALTALEANFDETVRHIAVIEEAIPPASSQQNPPDDDPLSWQTVDVSSVLPADLPELSTGSLAPHPDEPISDPALTPGNESPGNESPIIEEPLPPSSADNYLAQTRRAAQAAIAIEPDRDLRSGYRLPMRSEAAAASDGRKGSVSRLASVAALIVLVVAAGFYQLSAGGWQFAGGPGANAAVDQVPSAPDQVAAVENPAIPGTTASNPDSQTAATPAPPDGAVSLGAGPPNDTPMSSLAAQASSGDIKAALALGLKYAEGDGVAPVDAEAARWFKIAAEGGEPVAQYRLGTIYEKGRGVGADAREAVRWYREAARRGNRKAMHNLAVAYADGNGTNKNLAEAVLWFRAAAELGLTDSQFNLAVLYERGMGVRPSLAEAYKWYAIAAMSGDGESKARVAALTTQIQPGERAAADKAVQGYKPQPLNLAANDE